VLEEQKRAKELTSLKRLKRTAPEVISAHEDILLLKK